MDIFSLFCFTLLLYIVCIMQPCGHLLGKGLFLGSPGCVVFVCICNFPIRYPWSGVVLDCIDS